MPGIRAETCYLGSVAGGAAHGNMEASDQVVYFLQRGLYCVKYYGLLWGIVAAEKKMKGVKKNYQGKKKKFH